MNQVIIRTLIFIILTAAVSGFAHTRLWAEAQPQTVSSIPLSIFNDGFTLEVIAHDAFAAVISLPKPAEFSTFNLENPARFVIDIEGAVAGSGRASLDLRGGAVKRIRVAQFSRRPDVMRVVLELAAPQRIAVKGEGNQIIIRRTDMPETAPNTWTDMPEPETVSSTRPASAPSSSPAESTPEASILPAPKISRHGGRVDVSFPLQLPADAVLDSLDNPYRIVLDIPGRVPADALKTYDVYDGLVESVRVSHYNDEPPVSRVIIDCKLRADYRLDKKNGGFTLSVFNPSLYGKTIVVDPGHGGKDKGTSSTDGAYEKDLNLIVAFKLAALLEAAGAKVIMTRKSDVFIPLDERAYIANRAGADVFVSVHANALENHYNKLHKRGTQTYYYHEGSKALAGVVHKNMVSILGAGDLGMFRARYKVLRLTGMKAILCEMAYMTHPDDSILLISDEFRENVARGIFNGLNEYFGGRGAALPPLELPWMVASHLAGPSPASVFAASTGRMPVPLVSVPSVSELPPDLEVDSEDLAALVPVAQQEPEKYTASTGRMPVPPEVSEPVSPAAGAPSVIKSGPSRLNQSK